MKERFKVVYRTCDNSIYYGEVEGEEVLCVKGQRFFLHKYVCGKERQWRVSCALSGAAIGWGIFPEEALKMARKKLHFQWQRYCKKLLERPRAAWRTKA